MSKNRNFIILTLFFLTVVSIFYFIIFDKNIENQNKKLVNRVKLTDNNFSPNKEKLFLLSIKNDKVVIFNDKNKIAQITDIDTKFLPQKEINTLKDGILIKDEEELLAVLESILSIHNE
ncbi:MAG: BofC C-terminal domain-containing protein [Halanaerobiales bacterium]